MVASDCTSPSSPGSQRGSGTRSSAPTNVRVRHLCFLAQRRALRGSGGRMLFAECGPPSVPCRCAVKASDGGPIAQFGLHHWPSFLSVSCSFTVLSQLDFVEALESTAYRTMSGSCRNRSLRKWWHCTFLRSVRWSPSFPRNMQFISCLRSTSLFPQRVSSLWTTRSC